MKKIIEKKIRKSVYVTHKPILIQQPTSASHDEESMDIISKTEVQKKEKNTSSKKASNPVEDNKVKE